MTLVNLWSKPMCSTQHGGPHTYLRRHDSVAHTSARKHSASASHQLLSGAAQNFTDTLFATRANKWILCTIGIQRCSSPISGMDLCTACTQPCPSAAEVPQQQLAASNTTGCQIEQVQSNGLSLVWHIVPRVVVVVEGVAAAAAATMTRCAAGSQLSVV